MQSACARRGIARILLSFVVWLFAQLTSLFLSISPLPHLTLLDLFISTYTLLRSGRSMRSIYWLILITRIFECISFSLDFSSRFLHLPSLSVLSFFLHPFLSHFKR
jgi:hypothetical protein